MKKEKDKTTEQLINKTDIQFVNDLIKKSDGMENFIMSKSTLANIAGWALNGDSDKEIRQHLDLTKHQFAILCTVCPTLVVIMDRSRAMADLIVAGSLFQTAVGGKRIKKQQLIKVGVYENGVKVGEKVEKHYVEEELPPNPILLKFLAENKLSEQFGESKGVDDKKIRTLVDGLSAHDRKLIEEAQKKFGEINGEN